MAEFQEVMRQWARMCDACDNEEDVKCFINGNVCGRFHAMKDCMNVAAIEKTVMQWAAEHPEPVYPTWFQWLKSIGALPADQTLCHRGLENSIPADIAEKLGIEPKNG